MKPRNAISSPAAPQSSSSGVAESDRHEIVCARHAFEMREPENTAGSISSSAPPAPEGDAGEQIPPGPIAPSKPRSPRRARFEDHHPAMLATDRGDQRRHRLRHHLTAQ